MTRSYDALRSPVTVLVVDDDALSRLLIAEALAKHGYCVVGQAADGATAVELYRQLRPALVTLDVDMPVACGLTALREILDVDPDAVVVMCSAQRDSRRAVEALTSGAKDFVHKPVLPDELLDVVRGAVMNSSLESRS